MQVIVIHYAYHIEGCNGYGRDQLMTLTKDDLEWLNRIGVDNRRMKSIIENQEKVDKINAMWEQWNMRIETIKKLLAEIKKLKGR